MVTLRRVSTEFEPKGDWMNMAIGTEPPPSKVHSVIWRLEVKLPWMSQLVLERLKEHPMMRSLSTASSRTDCLLPVNTQPLTVGSEPPRDRARPQSLKVELTSTAAPPLQAIAAGPPGSPPRMKLDLRTTRVPLAITPKVPPLPSRMLPSVILRTEPRRASTPELVASSPRNAMVEAVMFSSPEAMTLRRPLREHVLFMISETMSVS